MAVGELEPLKLEEIRVVARALGEEAALRRTLHVHDHLARHAQLLRDQLRGTQQSHFFTGNHAPSPDPGGERAAERVRFRSNHVLPERPKRLTHCSALAKYQNRS